MTIKFSNRTFRLDLETVREHTFEFPGYDFVDYDGETPDGLMYYICEDKETGEIKYAVIDPDMEMQEITDF